MPSFRYLISVAVDVGDFVRKAVVGMYRMND